MKNKTRIDVIKFTMIFTIFSELFKRPSEYKFGTRQGFYRRIARGLRSGNAPKGFMY